MAMTTGKNVRRGSGLGTPLRHPGAPVNGTSGTFAGIAAKGARLIDTTNAVFYINTGTLLSPTWTIVGTQTA